MVYHNSFVNLYLWYTYWFIMFNRDSAFHMQVNYRRWQILVKFSNLDSIDVSRQIIFFCGIEIKSKLIFSHQIWTLIFKRREWICCSTWSKRSDIINLSFNSLLKHFYNTIWIESLRINHKKQAVLLAFAIWF